MECYRKKTAQERIFPEEGDQAGILGNRFQVSRYSPVLTSNQPARSFINPLLRSSFDKSS